MKRLALALAAAAALAGAGCGPSCTSGTTMVSWTGFDGPDAAVNQPCGLASGVDSVDIWLDGQFVGNWPCTDYGAAVPGVPTGGNILDVEGIAADGTTILFRDELSYGQVACGTVALQAFPGSGTAQLSYAFQAGSGAYCQNGSTYLWFTVYDDIANPNVPDPASIGAGNLPRAWPCGPTDPVVTLPNGQFDLGAIRAMSENPPGTFAAAATGCRLPITFAVTTGQQTVVSPVLADVNAACL